MRQKETLKQHFFFSRIIFCWTHIQHKANCPICIFICLLTHSQRIPKLGVKFYEYTEAHNKSWMNICQGKKNVIMWCIIVIAVQCNFLLPGCYNFKSIQSIITANRALSCECFPYLSKTLLSWGYNPKRERDELGVKIKKLFIQNGNLCQPALSKFDVWWWWENWLFWWWYLCGVRESGIMPNISIKSLPVTSSIHHALKTKANKIGY